MNPVVNNECVFIPLSEQPPWNLRCAVCGYETTNPTNESPERYHRLCGEPEFVAPTSGPGTEFMKLTDELGLTPPAGCSCETLRLHMDILGVAGCSRDFTRLKGSISTNLELWGWTALLSDSASAIWSAFKTGLAWRLNPLDPIGSLLEEAIRRAE